MLAMIFAAGLGTRLKPLTDHKPKALVEINGETMLMSAAKKLAAAGFDRIVVNIHHFSDMMRQYIQSHDFGTEIIISDESDMLLETGGGMYKAKDVLQSEPNFLMYNVDIATDLDLRKLYNYHISSNNLATLAVKKRETSRYLIFDNNLQLCAWKNIKTNEIKISRNFDYENSQMLAFSGISVAKREIFDLVTETGKFSITNLYLRLAQKHAIGAYIHTDAWEDMGKNYLQVTGI